MLDVADYTNDVGHERLLNQPDLTTDGLIPNRTPGWQATD